MIGELISTALTALPSRKSTGYSWLRYWGIVLGIVLFAVVLGFIAMAL
jgi:hypothetical protein